MRDADVHRRARWNVARFATLLLLVRTEQARVVALLHDDEGDARLVVRLELNTRLADCRKLVLQHVRELALGHTVPVEDDSVRLETTGRFVEHDQQLPYHAAQLLDDLLTMLLNAYGGSVSRRMRIHRTNHSRNRGLLVITGRWMGNVRTEEDHWFVEYFRSDRGHQDRVDSTQLHVDLETQIGERLW
uniref:Putative secreted peptide n=1 Tax=Anopheles braziliensis TaxID=58242 RepID=A0A2M3ZMP0_9DIPT